MSTVPYTFATDNGNIPLSQLDANFANVKASVDTAIVVTANSQPNITSVGTLTSVTVAGNVTGGNVLTGGQISATGNVTGNYFIGNGSQLTGLTATTSTALTNGTTNLTTAPNGNANITIGGTSNVVIFATTGEYITGVVSATANVTGGNLTTGGIISASGNISTANAIISYKSVTAPVPLASLTASAGSRAFVNNSNRVASGNFGAVIGSGGSNVVPAWSDGTNWYIG
jgi:hypothetical protein